MSRKLRTWIIWTLALAICLIVYERMLAEPLPQEHFATFLDHVARNEVMRVRIDGNTLHVILADGQAYVTEGLVDANFAAALSEQGVLLAWGGESDWFGTVILIGVPVIVVLALFLWFLRRMQGGTLNILELKRSRARLVSEKQAVTFEDVGGCGEAKESLRDVIDFLKHPDRWVTAGVRLPRGVLLEGPPGCGKTLLARAVAGETDARFWLVSGSEFVELFVGVGAARVRDMFETATKEAPSVIFIDEIDAVGRRRGSGIGAGHDEREQTLNQLLVCLDGFEQRDRVVVVAATNRADILDPALLRPGRFDRRVEIPPLGEAERLEVLRIHTRNKHLALEAALETLAEQTRGLSGADLESLVNEAGMLAVRRARRAGAEPDTKVVLTRADFEQAARPRSAPVRLDRVDALLIESTTQLAQPTDRALVRVTLQDGSNVEGELVWADAGFLKVRLAEAGTETILPKLRIRAIEALPGTEPAGAEDVAPDVWAGRLPDLA